ncbi:MAG: hypothetical protein IPH44_14815 [Myxococcales bacterium]|nr:hypothetical protein [Myxococcales bacterium]MBK7193202.1 hypothetical protein [Myxococcales bacterium]MBP6843527.1 hypothetical protein [Kofleriaceae bacterium]
MTGPRLVLRADASHRLGSGHVLRLAALAEAAIDGGGAATLVVGDDPAASLVALDERGLPAVAADGVSGSPAEGAATIALARSLAADAVVVDGPAFSPAYVAAVADAGLRVVAVDDLGLAPPPAEVVVNHNLGAEELAARYPAAATRLLGRRYHLLRREFRALPAGGATPRGRVERLLITMGGSDPAGATARVLGALPPGALAVTVVLGPGFCADRALAVGLATAERAGHQVELAYRPPDLAARMAGCDLAISAAGGTLAELAYLGRPTIAIAIAPDQLVNARRHAAAGLAAGGWPLAAVDDRELTATIAALIGDPLARRALAAAATAATDGRGAARVVAHLAA